MKNENTVLFVDDEKPILNSLKRSLIKEPYEKLFAESGAEALRIIDRQAVQVIVSDMKMPRMGGLELLKKVRSKSPDTIRMVLSGFADAEQLIACINSGEVYRYLLKPFEIDSFKQTIYEAIELYRQRQIEIAETQQLARRFEQIELSLKQHQLATEELLRLTSLDVLTTIPNRQSFDKTISHEWLQARRTRTPLSLLLIDINNLQQHIELNGQQAIDNCLKKIAWILRKTLRRPIDQLARFDEEKFAVLLPGTNHTGSAKIAERIISKIQGLEIENSQQVTISIGMVCKRPTLEDIPMQTFLTTANMALYAAQKSGLNCWIDMSEQLDSGLR